MLANDAGKRDRREIGFPTRQLEKGGDSHMRPLLRPSHIAMAAQYEDWFLLAFFGAIAELARRKVQDGKNSTQTAEGHSRVKSIPRKSPATFFFVWVAGDERTRIAILLNSALSHLESVPEPKWPTLRRGS